MQSCDGRSHKDPKIHLAISGSLDLPTRSHPILVDCGARAALFFEV